MREPTRIRQDLCRHSKVYNKVRLRGKEWIAKCPLVFAYQHILLAYSCYLFLRDWNGVVRPYLALSNEIVRQLHQART